MVLKSMGPHHPVQLDQAGPRSTTDRHTQSIGPTERGGQATAWTDHRDAAGPAAAAEGAEARATSASASRRHYYLRAMRLGWAVVTVTVGCGEGFMYETLSKKVRGVRPYREDHQQEKEGSPLTVCYGIPKMFRWLTDQYPQIMERISDGLPEDGADGSHIDNLYLDMNGIIHQSTHGNADEGSSAYYPKTLKEQFVRIFQFTDKVCKVVAPRKVIYLAVDGIAPRAKMNQQRSRRFRSSMEREEMEKELRGRYDDRGAKVRGPQPFDSNCITPGTEFMYKLTVAFKAWLEFKVKTDPFYQKPLVIFSGADVPGEGEHKVMDYVRERFAQGWDPELRHCFYGLDADLIMLSLVTHQPHFRLLREKQTRARPGTKKKDPLALTRYDFEILEVGLLREMIHLQFRGVLEGQGHHHKDREERLVDDFVFVCMLVGNDFLPQMPHLDILDGSLDLCLLTYRELAPFTQGFLTDKERIHLPRFELFARALAAHEDKYFARRGAAERVDEYQDSRLYRSHYYKSKFGTDDPDFIRRVAQEYVLGLFWCTQYYHKGVVSWDWFYPYLYAPLASDLVDLVDAVYEYPSTDSRPFTPLMQLLSVLPPQSKSLLPKPYADVMAEPGLRDAYPKTFSVDPNGKHQPWEAVVLIPFLDEDALIGHLSQIDHLAQLTPAERKRNDVANATVWYSRPPSPDDDFSDFGRITPPDRHAGVSFAVSSLPSDASTQSD